MSTFKELLSSEELKKLAFLLNKDARKLEEIGLEAAKKELFNQKQLAEKEDDLRNIDSLITKLDTLDEQDWKDSFGTEQSPNNTYPITVDNDNNRPMLLELNGDEAQQQDTLSKLENAYREITGREPEKKTYKNAEELPEQLKTLLANKPFPVTVVILRIDDPRQFKSFSNMIAPLVNEGKIKVTDITPQNASEAQEENANRPTFRR